MPELQSSPSASIYNPRAAICRLSGILNRANSKPIGRTASLSALTWSSADRWCAVRTWPNWFTKRRGIELGSGAGLGRASDSDVPAFPTDVAGTRGAGPAALRRRAGTAPISPLSVGLGRGHGVLVRSLLLDSVHAGVLRRRGQLRRLAAAVSVRHRERPAPGRLRAARRNSDAPLVGRARGARIVGCD